jgi:hypothetical protein
MLILSSFFKWCCPLLLSMHCDVAQHIAITICPYHVTPTIPTKVNYFHLLPSFGYHVNGILLETNSYCMTRPMTMTLKGGDKDAPGATPKQEA